MIKRLKSIMLLAVCFITATAFAQDPEMTDLELFQFNGPVKKISYYKANVLLGKLEKEYLYKTEVYTPNGYLISRRTFDINGNVIMMDSCTYEKGNKVKVYAGYAPDKLTLTQTLKYDSKHNIIEHSYLGNGGREVQKFIYNIKGKKRMSWEWYTMGKLFRKYDYNYNEKGELIEVRYDNFVLTSTYQDGKHVSTVGTDGFSYSAEYDQDGNKIKEVSAGIETTYKYENGFLVETTMTRPDNEMTLTYYKGQSVWRKVQKNDKKGNPIESQEIYSDGPGTPETTAVSYIFEYEYYK